MTSRPRTDALPFEVLGKAAQQAARTRVMRHIREALLRSPHSVLELRETLSPVDAGALPSAMAELVRAGEIAALGHCVYARVPYMPQMRPVEADPIRDLVLSALTQVNLPSTLATWLGLPMDTVNHAIQELQQLGLIEEYAGASRRGRYRIASPLMARQFRRGARGRVFADVTETEHDHG